MAKEISLTFNYSNPEYTEMLEYWEIAEDTIEKGSLAVKAKGETYLPKTTGMIKDTENGQKRYDAYKQRANFVNFGSRTIKKALGLMHYKNCSPMLSPKTEYLKDSFTIDGLNIFEYTREVNRKQLIYSRLGMLLDFDSNFKAKPYVVTYDAKAILDWGIDDNYNIEFVLLNESGYVFNYVSKNWEEKEQYRLLGRAYSIDGVELNQPVYYTATLTGGEYANIDIKNPPLEKITVPELNGRTLSFIPFEFCNATSLSDKPQIPVLSEQSQLALSFYRGDADYRTALYYQAFAILVLSGFDEEDIKRNGGIRIDGYISSSKENAKASYSQTSGVGLSEMRMSQDNLRREADREGIVITDKDGVESGKALATRITLQTSDLMEIALTSAEAIGSMCRIASLWLGEDEETTSKIKVIPNLDFNLENELPRAVFEMAEVYKNGYIPETDFYAWLKDNNYTKYPTYEEWKSADRMEILEDITKNIVDNAT